MVLFYLGSSSGRECSKAVRGDWSPFVPHLGRTVAVTVFSHLYHVKAAGTDRDASPPGCFGQGQEGMHQCHGYSPWKVPIFGRNFKEQSCIISLHKCHKHNLDGNLFQQALSFSAVSIISRHYYCYNSTYQNGILLIIKLCLLAEVTFTLHWWWDFI